MKAGAEHVFPTKAKIRRPAVPRRTEAHPLLSPGAKKQAGSGGIRYGGCGCNNPATISNKITTVAAQKQHLFTMIKSEYNMDTKGGVIMSLPESIRPSADLRNRYSEISRLCREIGEAVIITVNGRGDTVFLGYEQYQQMKAKIELLEMLSEAEDDVRDGRVAPMQETFDSFRTELLKRS